MGNRIYGICNLIPYKYINNPQGNSPDSDSRSESYDTSYKSTPDVEDINQDYTLNEYVSVEPEAKKQILDFYKQDPENAKKQFGVMSW